MEKPVTVADYSNQNRLLDENVSKMQNQLAHYQCYSPKLFDDLNCNRQFFGKVLQGSHDENVGTVHRAKRNIQFLTNSCDDTLLQKQVNSDSRDRLASNFKERLQRKVAKLSSTKEALNESTEYFLRCCPEEGQHQENDLSQVVSRLITLRAF